MREIWLSLWDMLFFFPKDAGPSLFSLNDASVVVIWYLQELTTCSIIRYLESCLLLCI
jgi:hypothetical protein